MCEPKFGPGGGCEEFRLSGAKSVLDAPAFVKNYGLSAYEYEAGNGLTASAESLLLIGQEAKRQGIAMSLHAPYFISLSSVELQKKAQQRGVYPPQSFGGTSAFRKYYRGAYRLCGKDLSRASNGSCKRYAV